MKLDQRLTDDPSLHFSDIESASISAAGSFDTPENVPDTFYPNDGRYNEGGVWVVTPSLGKYIYFSVESSSPGFGSSDIHFSEIGHDGYIELGEDAEASQVLANAYTVFDWETGVGRKYLPDTPFYQGKDYVFSISLKDNTSEEAEEEFTLKIFSDAGLQREVFSKKLFIAAGNGDYQDEPIPAVNVNNNVVNNTTNITNVNINNSGNGRVNVGDIGVVNNVSTIDSSFSIQSTRVNLAFAIMGVSKKKEKVEGTNGDDLIADGRGQDRLIGGDGADYFYFSGDEPFKKRLVDKVIDFDASEGDVIVVAEDVISNPAITDQVIDRLADTSMDEIPVADTRKQLKKLSAEGHEFIYNKSKGELLLDQNGSNQGLAGKGTNPVLAYVERKAELTDVLIDDVLDDLEAGPSLAIAENRKELKKLARNGYDLIYFEPRGDLYVDGNGARKGFGRKSVGGLIADLPSNTILTESDVLIGV